MSKGTCAVGLSVTFQVGEANFIKPYISFEEDYTGEGEDTRQAKFEELIQEVKAKLYIIGKEAGTIMDGMSPQSAKPVKKYKTSISEDDF